MSENGECGVEWDETYKCVATDKNGDGRIGLNNQGYCLCPISSPHIIFQVFAFVFSYAFPLVILFLSYYFIVREVHRVELKAHSRKLETTW